MILANNNIVNMDKILKAVQIYKSKYSREVSAFLHFVKERVDISEESYLYLQNIMLAHRQLTDKLNDQELKNYFHALAALHQKVKISPHSLDQLTAYTIIKYKSKDSSKKPIKTEEKAPKATQEPQEQVSPKRKSLKQEKKQEKQAKLQTIQENIVAENVQSSSSNNLVQVPTTSQKFFMQHPQAQFIAQTKQTVKKIQITGYEKVGQTFLNPIIKFRILFKEKQVYRRYTQFQNLMKYINKQYQGHILPELPPKEGIKSNFSYFKGVDEVFLNDRQIRLQEMINFLLADDIICENDNLISFLTDQNFQVEDETSKTNYLSVLSQMGFNATDIADYGIAYYNHLKSFNKADISTGVIIKYKQALPLFQTILEIEEYRNKINNNFDRRREAFKALCPALQDRKLTVTNFDKNSYKSATQIRNLQKQINKYLDLKSHQSLLVELINRKSVASQSSVQDLKKKMSEVIKRIQKMQANLKTSIDQLSKKKGEYGSKMEEQMIEWRKLIHP